MLLRPCASSVRCPYAVSTSRRAFFSLPFSSPRSPSPPKGKGSLTTKGPISIYTESRLLPYTPRELYSIIADVDAYADFLPFATTSTVLSATRFSPAGHPRSVRDKEWLDLAAADGERWEMDAELRAGAMGFEEGYVSRVQAVKFRSVSAEARDSTLFKHLHTSWTLSPVASTSVSSTSATNVDLYLAYAFRSSLHAAVVSGAWERVSAMMIDGFEKRLREVYGAR